MKIAVVFAAVMTVALGWPTASQWTLGQLSSALQNPNTNPALIPILEAALNNIMAAIHAGQNLDNISATPVIVPGVTSEWTLHELSEAIQDPSTNPAHLPYLEAALNQMMEALMSGAAVDTVTVSLPVVPGVVVPSPVLPPLIPAPVETPEVPSLPSTPASSPLVQIIVNVNQQGQQGGPETVAAPELVPETVNVVDQAPETVNVVDQAPETVNVVDQAPESVIVVENPGNPVDVIAINPPESNPIDVIAINPPELNPIDVVAINPPELNPIDVVAVNPPQLNPIDVVAVNPPQLNPIDVVAINPAHY